MLIRRVSFDLIGLPPTREEVREFIADESDDAYERLVDRLLAQDRSTANTWLAIGWIWFGSLTRMAFTTITIAT